MKLLILTILITLSHSDDSEKRFLKAGKKTVSLLKDYINTGKHLNKYLDKRSVKDELDAQVAKSKAKVLERARKSSEKYKRNEVLNILGEGKYEGNRLNGYHVDPVLNGVRRRGHHSREYEDSDSRSSSRELLDWKTEWKEKWMMQKIAAWNQTKPAGELGEMINMVAARPWGVPCGDPNQHDMPWGTCVLPVECDAEYRIYRGDYFCGRSNFICCAISFSTYDNYQALDVSLQDSALQTDSEEFRERKRQASRERHRKSIRDKRRRKRIREERKRKIRRTIQRIIREVKKILNRAYRNGSRIRRKKTRTMKKFIKYLKQQYRKDRDSAKDIHEHQMYEVDSELLKKLLEIKEVNNNFMTNETFRNVLLNRTLNMQSARMLVQAYPQLSEFINGNAMRRVGANQSPPNNVRRAVIKPSGGSYNVSDEVQVGGYATPPTGPKEPGSGDVVRRSMNALRRRLNAVRRSGKSTRRSLARRSGPVTGPNRRRRKHRGYDIEYGLLYS